jgi:hypothetical protein
LQPDRTLQQQEVDGWIERRGSRMSKRPFVLVM